MHATPRRTTWLHALSCPTTCHTSMQACSFASGIDTGCCLGDQLTALVLPSLEELEARGWGPPAEGVTRESLGARLVSVPARRQYVMPDED